MTEPLELFRFKCANHRYTADNNSAHFKRNNPLVCRVSARYNQFNRIEAGLPHTKVSLQSQYSPSTFNLQICKYNYKPASNLKYKLYKQCLNRQAEQLVHAHSGRKRSRDYTRREGWHHAQPKAWCHSGGSLPAGDGSYSTDQPCGTEVGHAELSVVFSKLIPKKDTSKTEYSNTQQGLPGVGYILAHN
jgi:hypothetical protein